MRSETGATVAVQGDRVRYTTPADTGDDDVRLDRFSYTISDGNGHTADGEATVRVLPELLAEPPFAQDDSATTEVDVPVTLDVLRNDGDPSGEPPVLRGAPGCAGVGVGGRWEGSESCVVESSCERPVFCEWAEVQLAVYWPLLP